MAVGAVYQIIANQGKMDNLLNANKFLKQRIEQIRCAKSRLARGDPNFDVDPSLNDIEKTHILLVNAKYKPFVTTAQEYYKQSYNGSINFGQEAQIPIPQFGDFFNDMALNVTLEAVSATVGQVPALPTAIKAVPGAGTQDTIIAGARVTEVINLAAKTYTRYIQRYCDITGATVAAASAASNFVRYCEYPGVRLCKMTSFEVNSTVLDKYSDIAHITVAKRRIMPHKLNAWKKLVGQEVSIESSSDLIAISGVSQYSAPITGVTDVSGQVVAPAAALNTSTYRVKKEFFNGPQTPAATQPILELWVPLWFWFNTDVHLAIPSAAIPFNNRYIKVQLANQADIVFVAPGNLFYELSVEVVVDADAGANSGSSGAVTIRSVNKYTRRVPQLASSSVVNTSQKILTLALFINNLFIDPDVHEMYIKRIGFSMVRVYLEQETQLTQVLFQDLMNMFKYPIEFFFLGARPTVNTTGSTAWRDWHRFQQINEDKVNTVVRTNAYNWVATDTILTAQQMNVQESSGCDTIYNAVNTISTLKVYVNAVELYKEESGILFTTYIPYNFGENTVSTVYDDGIHMVNFSCFPGIYQPTGHFNVSRTNNFYVQIRSALASASYPLEVRYIAKAINFLLIADGSCVLRYTA